MSGYQFEEATKSLESLSSKTSVFLTGRQLAQTDS